MQTASFYSLPRKHRKHIESNNMIKRLHEGMRCLIRVVRIFPICDSCLRFVRVLAVEPHECYLEANRYLNMDFPRDIRQERIRKGAWSVARHAIAFAQLDVHNPSAVASPRATEPPSVSGHLPKFCRTPV